MRLARVFFFRCALFRSHIPLEEADAKDALEAVEAMKAAILSSLLD
jgi:hypothetical protein